MNKRLLGFAVMAMLLLVPSVAFAAAPAAAAAAGAGSSAISIDMSGGMFTDRMVQIIALITILSLAPSILIMMTSFVRIVVVLSLLRTAIGVQTSPPNAVIVSLSLFLTLFVMGPTLHEAYQAGVQPMIAGTMTTEDAMTKAMVPM
jgi:flagellar biosynthetic protein FliP